MEKLDFTKYIGSYSLIEAKEIVKQMKADLFEAEKKEDLMLAKHRFGTEFTYELAKGTSPDLRKIGANQRVCASSIKGHHILMTKN